MKKLIVLGFFAAILFASCDTLKPSPQSGPRQKVPSAIGQIRSIPDSITLQTKDRLYYFFLDPKTQTLFMTDNAELYKGTKGWVAQTYGSGATYVQFEGTPIDPFAFFEKEQFTEEVAKKMGLSLNNYSVCRIFNYAFLPMAQPGATGPTTPNTQPPNQIPTPVQPKKDGTVPWMRKQ